MGQVHREVNSDNFKGGSRVEEKNLISEPMVHKMKSNMH